MMFKIEQKTHNSVPSFSTSSATSLFTYSTLPNLAIHFSALCICSILPFLWSLEVVFKQKTLKANKNKPCRRLWQHKNDHQKHNDTYRDEHQGCMSPRRQQIANQCEAWRVGLSGNSQAENLPKRMVPQLKKPRSATR